MNDTPVETPVTVGDSSVPVRSPGAVLPRWLAALQVLLVCGVPTELVIATVLAIGTGIPVLDGKDISLEFFAIVSLVDTAIVAMLVYFFLSWSGETSASVIIGTRSPRGEILRGLALLPLVFLGVLIVAGGLRLLLPWTHDVAVNPLTRFMRTPAEAAIFTIVVILAGGVREEIQRAFILHRFEQRLGGARVGLVVFSLAFGALHLYEGIDSAIVVGLLGLMWGVLYLRRRSALASMANHASFDAAQVMQLILVKAFGG
jgi:membrane protease YdiL (CAAX protease family)